MSLVELHLALLLHGPRHGYEAKEEHDSGPARRLARRAGALLALALALTDHLLTARRSVAADAALGTDLRRPRAVQDRGLTATAVPATVVGTLLTGVPHSPRSDRLERAGRDAPTAEALERFGAEAVSTTHRTLEFERVFEYDEAWLDRTRCRRSRR